MSEQEQDLIRIRAWKRYETAKQSYLTQKSRLVDWGKSLSALGRKLSDQTITVIEGDCSALPSHEAFKDVVVEFQDSVKELKQAFLGARDLGFPVEKDFNPKELGPF
jgi:hypothetical protein